MLKKFNHKEKVNAAIDIQRIENTFGDSFRYVIELLTFKLM